MRRRNLGTMLKKRGYTKSLFELFPDKKKYISKRIQEYINELPFAASSCAPWELSALQQHAYSNKKIC
jgi:hypothetical protein